MATPTAEKLIANIYLGYGSTAGSERVLLNYNEASTTTGFQATVIPVELATSVTDSSLNLASYVDTATIIAIRERNGVGCHVALASGVAAGSRIQIAANGFFLYKNANSTPPTLYFSNATGAADKAFIEVIVLGTSA